MWKIDIKALPFVYFTVGKSLSRHFFFTFGCGVFILKKSFWFLNKDPEMRLCCQITWWVYVLKVIFCMPSKYKGTIFFSWHSSAKVGRMAVVQVMCVWEICNIFFYSNSKNYAFRKPFISHLASSNSHKRCFNVGTKLILLSLSEYAALRHIISYALVYLLLTIIPIIILIWSVHYLDYAYQFSANKIVCRF